MIPLLFPNIQPQRPSHGCNKDSESTINTLEAVNTHATENTSTVPDSSEHGKTSYKKSTSQNVASTIQGCDDYKDKYDQCFNHWYRYHFLKGDFTSQPCQPLFEDYQACIMEQLELTGLHEEIQFSNASQTESKEK